MAKWIYRLEIGDLHRRYEENTLSTERLGKEVAARLREHPAFKIYQEDLAWIVEKFEEVQEIEDYDDALEDLYDWADRDYEGHHTNTPFHLRKKNMWIDTFETRSKHE